MSQVEVEFREMCELSDSTIEALLLQFDGEGFNLPGPYFVRCVLKEIPKEQFGERVREGLSAILRRGMIGPEHGMDSIEGYMTVGVRNVEWTIGYGERFRFRIKPEVRADMEQRVGEYWSAEELKDFGRIGEILRERTKSAYDEKGP